MREAVKAVAHRFFAHGEGLVAKLTNTCRLSIKANAGILNLARPLIIGIYFRKLYWSILQKGLIPWVINIIK